MLTDYVIMPGADYQDACDAIREKTGKTDAIVSGDMGEEIRGISGGGSDLAKQIAERTVTEIDDDTLDQIGMYGLSYCKQLTSVRGKNIKVIDSYGLYECSALSELYVPNATSIASSCIYRSTMLAELSLPSVETISSSGIANCTNLRRLDLGAVKTIGSAGLGWNSNLKILILRRIDTVCAPSNSNFLQYTPFDGKGGHCFVPRDLITAYQEATNWSTLYAAGTCTFLALEDYTVDGTTTGEMDWDKVNALDEEATA